MFTQKHTKQCTRTGGERMQKFAENKDQEKKSWEQPYKNGNIKEEKGQFKLFKIYKDMGALRSILDLQRYCEKNKKQLEADGVSFPHPQRNILQMERQIPLGRTHSRRSKLHSKPNNRRNSTIQHSNTNHGKRTHYQIPTNTQENTTTSRTIPTRSRTGKL